MRTLLPTFYYDVTDDGGITGMYSFNGKVHRLSRKVYNF